MKDRPTRAGSRVRVAGREDSPRVWAVGALALMLGAALFLSACGGEEGAEEPAPSEDTNAGEAAGNQGESEGPNVGVTLSDIAENPEEFIGATVTISGEVNEVLTPQGFTIGGEEFFGTDELLILGAEELPNIVTGVDEEFITDEPELVGPNDIVQVTGTVGQFEVQAAEDEIGSDLDEDLFAEYEDEPFVIAETIALTPSVSEAGETLRTPVEDISGNPSDFVGATVVTDGVVGQIVEPRSFVLSASDEAAAAGGVLVVNPEGSNPNLVEGQTLQVEGPVRIFDVGEFEEEFGLDLDEGLYAPFAETPAIVASSIQQMQGGEATTQQ